MIIRAPQSKINFLFIFLLVGTIFGGFFMTLNDKTKRTRRQRTTPAPAPTQKILPIVTGLNADGPKFLLNGEEFRILSGAIHYFRIPHQYWKDRLLKAKKCGLNTVETYVPWNLHEENPGEFNFTANLDIVRFINLAKEIGLHVIVRPGPYICSEWDW